ncbi:MAG: ATP-binding protein [Vicinamibacterales bacterium]
MASLALAFSHRPVTASLVAGDHAWLTRLYLAGVIAAGYTLMLARWPTSYPHAGFSVVLLVASLALSLLKMRLPLKVGQATISMAYTVDFAALLLCGPDVAMLIATFGVLVQCLVAVKTPQPIIRLAFSVAAIVLSVQASGYTWSLLGGTIDHLSLVTTIGPMSAAASVYFIINSVLVAFAIALTASTSPARTWQREFLWSAPSYFLSATVGTMMAIILSHGTYALLLLTAVPLYLSQRAYQASMERIEVERMHARELASMVTTTREALSRATHSEVALVGEKERLALERTRLAVTLQTITEGVVTVDGDGDILLMNESAATLTGVPATAAANRPVTDLFRAIGIEQATYADAMRRVLEAGEPVQVRCALAVPSARVVDLTGTPMRDGDDRLAGAVWVLRDVTDATRIEHERSKTARLESLGVLAGGLAHDFNNILMGVVGNLSLAQSMAGTTTPALMQRLRDAEAACVRARGVTTQLLTFAKGGAPVKTAASIRELVVECARFALSGSRVAGRFSVEPDLWSAEVDAVQISQVVHNLVLNAVQAMPHGGTVDVLMRNVRVDAASPANALNLPSGNYVSVSVIDQGPGIATEHLARIFEPYFTTKEKGSGLGLAISSSIVRAHGGTLAVGSTASGTGTRFDVYLPASSGQVVSAVAAVANVPMELTGRVLLMDDDPMVAEVAQDMLATLGYTAVTASCGRSAIEKMREAERNGQPFDLVILDLTVPGGMGGQETVPHLRQMRADIPVLVMSGYADNSVLADHGRHGFDGVLPKPFAIPDLRTAVEQVNARRSARPRPPLSWAVA